VPVQIPDSDDPLIPQRAPPLAAVKAEPGGGGALQKSRSDGVFGGSPRAANAAASGGAASAEQLPSGKVTACAVRHYVQQCSPCEQASPLAADWTQHCWGLAAPLQHHQRRCVAATMALVGAACWAMGAASLRHNRKRRVGAEQCVFHGESWLRRWGGCWCLRAAR